ncbi:MAG: PD-(D/E)XK nuclease family protein, partial [Chloroflexota bacterium]
ARRRPPRARLKERLQTRVYPYLLACAGGSLNGGRPVQPGQIEMVYWFPAFPGEPERFAYSAAQMETDGAYLAQLVDEITARAAQAAVAASPTAAAQAAGAAQPAGGGQPAPSSGAFPLTARPERCAYCVYRSLCQRGERAGGPEDEDDLLDDPGPAGRIDFEQVGEIAF